MRNTLKWPSVLLVFSACGLIGVGSIWIRQYQQLADDKPEIILSQDVSDLTYCTVAGVPLKMDLYFPENSQAASQVLVYVHGGSFTGGDKRKGSGIVDIPAMTSRGYAVAAINYRLMPAHPFPAAVQDAKCAIRFLRAHAEEYHLRTDKIGIWGGSAGGHLASMVGLTGGEADFETGEYLEQSSRVDAVVEMFGPTDLTMPMGWLQRMLLRRAFGTDDPQAELLHRASPVNYVQPNSPPFLILHGEQDSAVPVEQARVLYKNLVDAGNSATLIAVKNAHHNFKPTGGVIQPSRQEISETMADFYDHWLNPGVSVP